MLQALIRIPSVNPPGDEILRRALRRAGPRRRRHPLGGRRAVPRPRLGRRPAARRRHRRRADPPALAPRRRAGAVRPLDARPVRGDVADGYVWGRGAVDMKGMVAHGDRDPALLAAEARAAGRDPATDPVPGLTRDVLFASTADEEAGGIEGAGWVAEHRPDWIRRPAPSTRPAASRSSRRPALLPDPGRREGLIRYRIRVRGTWGHGSMPREDNAAVRAAEVVTAARPVRARPADAGHAAALRDRGGGAAGRGGDAGPAQSPATTKVAARRPRAALQSDLSSGRFGRSCATRCRPNMIHSGSSST